MPFISGTATSHKNMLDQLVDMVTSSNVTAVASIAGGGTGYAVNDILTVSGGTSSHTAKLRVTSVAAGVIDGIAVEEGGAYTVSPSNPVSVTGGGGSGATFNLTITAAGWTANRDGLTVGNVTINAGGTGYTLGDQIVVSGGTGTVTATLTVTSVSSGVIDGIEVATHGFYSALPANPVSVTGGTGSGATFNLTSEQEAQLQGSGGGSDSIYVGIRTFLDIGASASNWELAGFTGYSSSADWKLQPNISPGRFDDTQSSGNMQGGAFVLLANTTLNFWIAFDARRITGVIKASSTYESFYLGWINPFATDSEQPYPLVIAGSCPQPNTIFSSTRAAHSSITWPILKEGTTRSGFLFRHSDGTWYDFANAREDQASSQDGAIDSEQTNRVVFPTGYMNFVREDQVLPDVTLFMFSDQTSMGTLKNPASLATAGVRVLSRTPDGLVVPWPCTMLMKAGQPSPQILGELSGIFWLSAFDSGLNPEDELVFGSRRFYVFHEANNTDFNHFFAIERK